MRYEVPFVKVAAGRADVKRLLELVAQKHSTLSPEVLKLQKTLMTKARRSAIKALTFLRNPIYWDTYKGKSQGWSFDRHATKRIKQLGKALTNRLGRLADAARNNAVFNEAKGNLSPGNAHITPDGKIDYFTEKGADILRRIRKGYDYRDHLRMREADAEMLRDAKLFNPNMTYLDSLRSLFGLYKPPVSG